MAEAVKLRRPVVSCVRDFPKGCAPRAVAVDRKPKPPPSPPPLPPSSPPADAESQEVAACNGVAEPRVGASAEALSAEVRENSCSADGLVVVPNVEPVEFSAPVGCLEPDFVDSSSSSLKNVVAAEVKQEEKPDQGMQGSSNQDGKLEPPQLLENGFEQSKASDALRTDATPHADGNPEKRCFTKMYPPPRRRAVSAVRDYPICCGVNALRMSREQALKRAAAASSKGKRPIEEIKPVVDQQPAAPEDLPNGKVPADNRVAEGIEKRMEIRSNEEETIQQVRVEAKVSKFPLPSPKRKSLEVEKQPQVVKEAISGKDGENKILARAASDKRLDGRAIKPLSRNLQTKEAQRSKPPGPNKLVDEEGQLSLGKSDDKLLVKRQKACKFTDRKSSDAIADDGRAGIDQKLDSENLEAYGQRLIIQALMAAPNCPWRQGRKSGTSGSRSVVAAKSKVKRERATLDMQLALPKVKRDQTTSNMQLLALKEVEDEDFASDHEENETALIVYRGSGELSVTVPPLTIYEGSDELCVSIPPIAPSGWDYSGSGRQDIVARHKVRRALRLFQVVCRKLLQGEEAKSKGSGNTKRVDLTAAQILKQKHEWVNTGKQIIGIVPGVEVGDEFQYRVELSIVGLHRPFQGGIDCVKKDGLSIATSIVASGGYNDDMDSSDVLIYSGSGGNPAGPDKPPEDQKLERGNLALKNSIDANMPVRVIHGTKEMKGGNSHDTRPKLVSTFTYAGLYLVEKYWQEKGPHGFYVFKFQLRRIPGQPELALQEAKRSKKSKVREGLCVKDISDGKEKIPICAINTVNDECPSPFKYTTNIKYPSWYTKTPPKGCDCMNGCSDSGKCACAVKNGGEIPFNFNGAIVQAKPLVYECGPSCRCPPSCHNRVSQRGIQIPLEIFRTKTRGWGVRSLYSIPSGSFICEYVGELLLDKEAEKRSNDEYLFDIGHNYDDHSLWEGLPSLIPGLKTNSQCETVNDVGFTIDAAEYGNVGRFINHSCSPNLYAQNVLYDHDDKRIPHIMFFAAENIPPLQELAYHYNYSIDQIRDAEGNIKQKDCYCGSPECTGRLY